MILPTILASSRARTGLASASSASSAAPHASIAATRFSGTENVCVRVSTSIPKTRSIWVGSSTDLPSLTMRPKRLKSASSSGAQRRASALLAKANHRSSM